MRRRKYSFQKMMLALLFASLVFAFQNCAKFETGREKVGNFSSVAGSDPIPDPGSDANSDPEAPPPPPQTGGTPKPPAPAPSGGYTLPNPGAPYTPPPASAIPNTMVVAEKSGAVQTNYPLQLGRPFLQGEIANFPQVIAGTTPLPTQADVKQRYSDGSVKYAVISTILPSLSANGSATLSFRNQASGNNTPLTQAQMLASNFDFDALIKLTKDGNTITASARAMLQAGAFTYWASGPVATTVILADHSINRAFDIGFDSYKSLRPIFHATFWPTLNKVKVRVVGENASIEYMQDFIADVQLEAGYQAPRLVYTQAAVTNAFGTRWTKTAWIGGEPEMKINLDHNIAYVAATKFMANYDASVAFPETLIQSGYDGFMASSREFYEDANVWTRYMPQTGGRQDIGPNPGRYMAYIYTGDWRAREVALGSADLAGAWRMHFRETSGALKFDRAKTIPAIGRIVSINARDLRFPDDGKYGAPRPQLSVFDGTTFRWKSDTAHSPDPFTAPYIFTGDFFYLEGAQFWASSQAIAETPGGYGRGLAGRAGMRGQARQVAWGIRNRANAAFLSVDGSPEKQLLTDYMNDFIAQWEGAHNFTGSALQSDAQWAWARTGMPFSENSPLGFWYHPTSSTAGESQWQAYFITYTLGMAKEKGFATDRLLSHISKVLNTQFVDPNWDPRALACYYVLPSKPDATYFQTWGEMRAYMESSGWTACKPDVNIANFDPNNGYAVYATAAAAMAASEPGGNLSWPWIDANVRKKLSTTNQSMWQFNVKPR